MGDFMAVFVRLLGLGREGTGYCDAPCCSDGDSRGTDGGCRESVAGPEVAIGFP